VCDVAQREMLPEATPGRGTARGLSAATVALILATSCDKGGATKADALDASRDVATDSVARPCPDADAGAGPSCPGGLFEPAVTYTIGLQGPLYSVVAGAFSANGQIGLAVTGPYGYPDEVAVMERRCGAFGAPVAYPGGGPATQVTRADLDGDGVLDLVLATSTNAATVLLGRGDGTFGPARAYGPGEGYLSLAVADFNGDGRPDVATAQPAHSLVALLLGNGDGTFRQTSSDTDLAVGEVLFAADFDGDGKIDLGSTKFVFLGHGDGTFAAGIPISAGYAQATGDFNGDGKPDLLSADGEYFTVLLGRGDGTFNAAAPRHIDIYTILMGQPIVADVDGDGRADAVVPESGAVLTLLGDGSGALGPQVAYQVPGDAYALVVADLNGDGRPDLAVAQRSPLGDGADGIVSVLYGCP
jgi:hypothetical protein